MTRYIANEENLKVMMNLLKDRSKNIQFEAFNVFKVGVLASLPLGYGTNVCSLACVTKREREEGTDLLEHRFPSIRPSARSLSQNPPLRTHTHTQHQIFVANPKKPPQIEAILRRNKDKLVAFLRNFHNDRDDEQFNVRTVLAGLRRVGASWTRQCADQSVTRRFCPRAQDEKLFLLQQIEAL